MELDGVQEKCKFNISDKKFDNKRWFGGPNDSEESIDLREVRKSFEKLNISIAKENSELETANTDDFEMLVDQGQGSNSNYVYGNKYAQLRYVQKLKERNKVYIEEYKNECKKMNSKLKIQPCKEFLS